MKRRIGIGSVVAVVLGSGLLFRGLYRPIRSVVRSGRVSACPGTPTCSPAIVIELPSPTDLFALTPGTVAEASPGRIKVASSREPIFVLYTGSFTPTVAVGARVGMGQHIGYAAAGSVKFSLTDQTGTAIEPTSWLALRGLRPVHSPLVGTLRWCSGGTRQVDVPEHLVSECKMKISDPSSIMLLPVTVQTVSPAPIVLK